MRDSRRTGTGRRESGQIVVLFAISLVAIIAMGSLVYTGAQALVLRRQLQNVGDAAALAGANVVQVVDTGAKKIGCSLAGPGGTPRQSVIDAAKASVATNLPSYDPNKVTVTCPVGTITTANPVGYNNMAVAVALSGISPAIFGGLAGSGLPVSTKSVAVNGQITESKYSVVMLDRSNLSWGGAYNGCPSFLIGGGIQATFEASIMVNSRCLVQGSYKGGMDANGGSAVIQMSNGATIRVAGEYNQQNLQILPSSASVVNHVQPPVNDPLAGVTDPVTFSTGGLITLPARSLCPGNYTTCVLQPGIYAGGINQTGGGIICMTPGIYVMNGGGFNIGGGAVVSVPAGTLDGDCALAGATSTSWFDDHCALGSTTCGVLIYNTNLAQSPQQKNVISVGANSTVRLRAYIGSADSLNGPKLAALLTDYDHILFWQDRNPPPRRQSSDSGAQTQLSLSGGGNVILSGTVYAPGAQVLFSGTSSGSGGVSLDLRVQFICWDLQLQGNTNFVFRYSSNEYPTPTSYGLVQ